VVFPDQIGLVVGGGGGEERERLQGREKVVRKNKNVFFTTMFLLLKIKMSKILMCQMCLTKTLMHKFKA
jgi:hypothetical protein